MVELTTTTEFQVHAMNSGNANQLKPRRVRLDELTGGVRGTPPRREFGVAADPVAIGVQQCSKLSTAVINADAVGSDDGQR